MDLGEALLCVYGPPCLPVLHAQQLLAVDLEVTSIGRSVGRSDNRIEEVDAVLAHGDLRQQWRRRRGMRWEIQAVGDVAPFVDARIAKRADEHRDRCLPGSD